MKILFLFCLFIFSYNYSMDKIFAERLKNNRNLLLENNKSQKKLIDEIENKEKNKKALSNNLEQIKINYLATIKNAHENDKRSQKNDLRDKSIECINESFESLTDVQKQLFVNLEEQKQKKYYLKKFLDQENQLLQDRRLLMIEKKSAEVIKKFLKTSLQKLQSKQLQESMQMHEEENFEKNRLAQIVQDQKKQAKILSEKAVQGWQAKKDEQEKKRLELEKEKNKERKKLKDLDHQRRLQEIEEEQQRRLAEIEQERLFEVSKQEQIDLDNKKREEKKVAEQEKELLVKVRYEENKKLIEKQKNAKDQFEATFSNIILKIINSNPFDVFRCNYKKNGLKNTLDAIKIEHALKKLVTSVYQVIKDPTVENFENFNENFSQINKKSQELDYNISWYLLLNPQLDKSLLNSYHILANQDFETEKKILHQELRKYENIVAIFNQEKLIYEALVNESLQAIKEKKDIEKNKEIYKKQLFDLTEKTKAIDNEIFKFQASAKKLEEINRLSNVSQKVDFYKGLAGILTTSHLQHDPNMNRYKALEEKVKTKAFDTRSLVFKQALVEMQTNELPKYQQNLLISSVLNLLPGNHIELLTKNRLKQVMHDHDLFVVDEIIDSAFFKAKMYSRGGIFFNKDNFMYEFDREIKHVLVEKNIPYTQEQVNVVMYETLDILKTFAEVFPMKNS